MTNAVVRGESGYKMQRELRPNSLSTMQEPVEQQMWSSRSTLYIITLRWVLQRTYSVSSSVTGKFRVSTQAGAIEANSGALLYIVACDRMVFARRHSSAFTDALLHMPATDGGSV